jgi:hypothetical protein
MPACPQCTKPLRELVRKCPSCQADLDLLVDYVSHLSGGVERAEKLARDGELGEAVWTYLEVLETDPDNAAARKQVGRIVTAVRRFDMSTAARRVAIGLPPEERTGFWKNLPRTDLLLSAVAALFVGLFLGVLIGLAVPRAASPTKPAEDADAEKPAPINKPNDQQLR